MVAFEFKVYGALGVGHWRCVGRRHHRREGNHCKARLRSGREPAFTVVVRTQLAFRPTPRRGRAQVQTRLSLRMLFTLHFIFCAAAAGCRAQGGQATHRVGRSRLHEACEAEREEGEHDHKRARDGHDGDQISAERP